MLKLTVAALVLTSILGCQRNLKFPSIESIADKYGVDCIVFACDEVSEYVDNSFASKSTPVMVLKNISFSGPIEQLQDSDAKLVILHDALMAGLVDSALPRTHGPGSLTTERVYGRKRIRVTVLEWSGSQKFWIQNKLARRPVDFIVSSAQ